MVVGAHFAGGSGAAYVFEKPPGGWSGSLNEDAKLIASDGAALDFFGESVAISGGTVVVGAHRHDGGGDDSGQAYVFEEPPGGWSSLLTEDARLTASDAATGDTFGTWVSISGDIVVVGAPWDDDAGINSGSAYVFEKPAGGWSGALTQDAKLTASDEAEDDNFGIAVAVSGGTVVVGARWDDDNGSQSGSAYVVEEPAGGWSGGLSEDAKLTASDGGLNDWFGFAVGVSGSTVVVGAPFHDAGGTGQGAAYVFLEPAGGWGGSLTEDVRLMASDAADDDKFGVSVAVSAGTVVVGAEESDGGGEDSGSAYVFDFGLESAIFSDGFESGDTSAWSQVVP